MLNKKNKGKKQAERKGRQSLLAKSHGRQTRATTGTFKTINANIDMECERTE